MKIGNQDYSLVNINLDGHIIIAFDIFKDGLNLKVNEPHDFLENVLIDELNRELDEAGVVGQ
jgi:hypothetical protein